VPGGLPLLPFGVWTAMHYLQLFANREYGVLVVYHEGRSVHRSALFPRYARFPFMAREDLQIGDVWTDPGHRNRGLASFAIQRLVQAKARRGRRIWYLVESGNAPSVRAVAKLGFVRAGTGTRTKRLGLAVFGQFVLDSTRELA
jgi:RimJ/RimL family protein N-acetyltransferase